MINTLNSSNHELYGCVYEATSYSVTRSVFANSCLMGFDWKTEVCSCFTNIIVLPIIAFLYFSRYTALDELHENNPGLAIDVVTDSVK